MIRLLSALMAVFLLASCTTSPTTGQPIFTGIVSEERENAMAGEEHASILKQFNGVNDTADLNVFVAQIGARLVPYAERRNMRWTFTVLNDDMVNAFATGGGYVYITRGLLALAQDESQVAAVLAHEMGHINARHVAQQQSQGMVANIGLQAIGIATGSNVATQLGGTGAELYLKSFSRAHEYEADSLGVKYLAAAGYDPYAEMKFLQQLQRSTELEARMAGKPAQGELFSYMSTHPSTPDRVVRAKALADAATKSANAATDRASYLRAINGTVYGDAAQKGFVRGTEFVHPDLQIRYEVPQGFTLKNGDKSVVARDGKGALVVFDTANGNDGDPVHYLALQWAGGAELTQPETITVNGLNGATAGTTVQTSEGTKEARMVALHGDGNMFYRLLFLTPPGQMNNYATVFCRTTYSFAHDESIARISPPRVKVITVRAGDTVQSLAARMNVTDFALERFCLMNNLLPDDKLPLGEQVKIVQ